MKPAKSIQMCLLACITAVVLWSASFIATKIAYETLAPIQLGFVRTLLAVIVFWLIRQGTRSRERLDRRDWLRAALSGLLGMTLYFAFENVGVSLTTASNAALIVASFPAMTMLLEFVIYKQKPTGQKIIGMVLALAGVAALTGVDSGESDNALLGNLCLLGAGVVWAFYNFITRGLSAKYSSMTLTYYQMLTGTVWFVPIVLWEGAAWEMPTTGSLSAVLFLCLGCSVLAFVLYNYGLKQLTASVSVSLLNLVPVLGLLLSVWILDETVTPGQLAGGIVVIIGVVLSTVPFKKRQNVELSQQ